MVHHGGNSHRYIVMDYFRMCDDCAGEFRNWVTHFMSGKVADTWKSENVAVLYETEVIQND